MIRYDIIRYHFSTKGIQMKRILLRAILSVWFTGLCFANKKDEFIANKKTPIENNISSTIGASPHDASLAVTDKVKSSSINPAFQLLHSIQRDLQDPKYRQDILASNFSYLVQLLDHGNKTHQNSEYVQDVVSLFSKLLKGVEYVNCYAFSGFIEQMPGLLKSHFMGYKLESGSQLILANDLDMLERLEKMVTSIVLTKFTQDFALCQTNPKLFLDNLSQRIVMATAKEVTTEHLRQIIIRFLEVGLSKLIWSPRDEEKTWELVKTISHNIFSLMEYNIIDNLDDIDDLYWTLIYRYRYFLELNSSDMPLAFYKKIHHDILNQKLLLFELEEQESFLQTKSSCLLNAVLTQAAKKQAYDYTVPEPRAVNP